MSGFIIKFLQKTCFNQAVMQPCNKYQKSKSQDKGKRKSDPGFQKRHKEAAPCHMYQIQRQTYLFQKCNNHLLFKCMFTGYKQKQ